MPNAISVYSQPSFRDESRRVNNSTAIQTTEPATTQFSARPSDQSADPGRRLRRKSALTHGPQYMRGGRTAVAPTMVFSALGVRPNATSSTRSMTPTVITAYSGVLSRPLT
jgi:hypothetical protein